jgi:hypothetical protein
MFGLHVTAWLIYRIFGGFGVFHVISLINVLPFRFRVRRM